MQYSLNIVSHLFSSSSVTSVHYFARITVESYERDIRRAEVNGRSWKVMIRNIAIAEIISGNVVLDGKEARISFGL